MTSRFSLGCFLRVLLILGRVSNLPTVWSNCLAAWWLADGSSWGKFTLVCAGATLLYTGGMFLNDACDVAFDRQYRPERPIPSGEIGPRTVWFCAVSMLALGWLILGALGTMPAMIGAALALTIVVYDVLHKRVSMAPLLMASCRFLLYVLAAAAAQPSRALAVLGPAAALAVYVLGVSCLARGESSGAAASRWPMVLLAGPILLALGRHANGGWPMWIPLFVLAGWVVWCLRHCWRMGTNPGPAVPGLLAGIALVDWVAASGVGGSAMAAMAFAVLFVLALALQRLAPAS